MGYKRTRKQARLDEERTFDDMVKQGPRENARKAFKRDVRKEYGVKQCLTKWGVDLKEVIKGDIIHEQKTEKETV